MEHKTKMPAIKIGIVEDEGLIAESIMQLLISLGYDVLEPASDYLEAINMLERHKPDLVMLDINLGEGMRNGIELAKFIKQNYGIPFIFLTANADKATVEQAKETEPAAYLIKPFTKTDLYATIEVAVVKHISSLKYSNVPFLYLKDGSIYRKVSELDIMYVESEHVYLNIYTHGRNFLMRSTVDDFYSKLSQDRFVKIGRSYLVNIHHITSFTNDAVEINGATLPISKTHKKSFLEKVMMK